jgi:acyl-CoA thioester hydrolase
LYEFKLKKLVEFVETDLAGIMHFSNFFRFMEMTEHAFFRSLGWSVHPHNSELDVVWPRVNAQCDFKQPLYFEDTVEIHLLVYEIKEKSIRYLFHFNKLLKKETKNIAVGSLTVVCSRYDQVTHAFKATPVPNKINNKIEVAPDHLLHLY